MAIEAVNSSSISPTMSLSNSHSQDEGVTMNNEVENNTRNQQQQQQDNNNDGDDHEHDMVMPGFRFHPTEEELVEFYLRRKVEGKRFNVELITFLDLYRYDPWELPAMAAIGEKEWYFYVPRDRKYRNGDRPNRVTTSGYWKATGADRMIRTDNFRSIGLKKTLVFYSGKAPKGIRTSWIMNEYRLPHHDTQRYQKAEISLCRVYKRAGVEDHHSLPLALPTRPSSSSSRSDHHNNTNTKKNDNINVEMIHHQNMGSSIFVGESTKPIIETDGIGSKSITTSTGLDHHHDVSTALGLSKHNSYHHRAGPTIMDHQAEEEQGLMMNMMMQQQQQQQQQQQHHSKPLSSSLVPTFFPSSSSNNNNAVATIDDLNRLLTYQQQQQYYNNNHLSTLLMQPPPNSLPTTFSDHRSVWEWNPFPDQPNRDYNNLFFK
ncbi:hypothetical protein Lal_00040754 [Lupinus albus]|uniref:Putative transcription factor NAM family n=1 Tax=Lupinus albus TaxID=3870 RepID=A0A6A5NM89_LUPAL|nr:putative transcription factor NAM family [Lupinus albus]KAF1887157.1 hypothetical protein Lal_00040754 [Lupinus albus]